MTPHDWTDVEESVIDGSTIVLCRRCGSEIDVWTAVFKNPSLMNKFLESRKVHTDCDVSLVERMMGL